eukprot:TRINITY_DN9233_c2_g1_i1.p1 TRINITY_DN9233_c2_g1~~TRINITY_DN9233_c2_g1_i1.p1  ORF type:complete len:1007 (+),score=147.66 TRINITY_DN9233_c2_g1_i1:39-3059(+)
MSHRQFNIVLLVCLLLQSCGGQRILNFWDAERTAAVDVAIREFGLSSTWTPVMRQPAPTLSTVEAICSEIAQGDVVGILGPNDAHQVKLAGWLASIHGIPMMTGTSTSDIATSSLYQTLRRTVLTDINQAESISKFIVQLGWNKATAFYEQQVTGLSLVEAMVSQGYKAGLEVTTIPLQSNVTLTLEETSKQSMAQLYLILGSGELAVEVLSSALKIQPPLIGRGAVWFTSEDLPLTNPATFKALQANSEVQGIFSVFPRVFVPPELLATPEYESQKNNPTFIAAFSSMLSLLKSLDKSQGYTNSYQNSVCHDVLTKKWNLGLDSVIPELDTVLSGEVLVGSSYELLNLQQFGGASEWNVVGGYDFADDLWIDSERIQWPGGSRPTPTDVLRNQHLKIIFPCQDDGLSYETSSGVGKGILWDIVDTLGSDYGFTYTPYISCYQCDHENCIGGYTLAQVGEGEFDMFAVALTITPDRQQFLKFAQPWTTDTKRLMIQTPSSDRVDLWRFLTPMQTEVYLAALLVIVASGFGLWLLEAGRNELIPRGFEGFMAVSFLSFTSFFMVNENAPVTHSGRLLVAGLFFFAIVFTASYTAELTTFLTRRSSVYPVDSFEDFQTGKIGMSKLGVPEGSATESILTGPSLRMTGYTTYTNDSDAIAQLKAGSIDAALASTLYFPFQTDCDVELRGPDISELQLFKAFALPYESRFVDAISYGTMTLLNDRIIDNLRTKHVHAISPDCGTSAVVEDEELTNGMSIESMWGPLIVFGTIFGCAMFMRSIRLLREYWLSRDEDRELTRKTWGNYFQSLPLVDVAAIASSILDNPNHYRVKGELCSELASKMTSYMDGASFFTHVGLIQLIIAAESIGVDVTSCEDQDDIIYSLREFVDRVSLDYMTDDRSSTEISHNYKNALRPPESCSSGSHVSLTSSTLSPKGSSSRKSKSESTVSSPQNRRQQIKVPAPLELDPDRKDDNETCTELDTTIKQASSQVPESDISDDPQAALTTNEG